MGFASIRLYERRRYRHVQPVLPPFLLCPGEPVIGRRHGNRFGAANFNGQAGMTSRQSHGLRKGRIVLRQIIVEIDQAETA